MSSVSSANFNSFVSTASAVASSLDKAESRVKKAYEGGDQKAISTADIEYKKANLIFESFMKLMSTRFETMMRAIQNLATR